MSLLPHLVGHWPLSHDGRDVSGNDLHAEIHGEVTFHEDPQAGGSASFATGARAEVVVDDERRAGISELTVSGWIRAEADPADVLGSIVSWFDPETRTGFELAVQHGVATTHQHNTANLEFGVDWGSQPTWQDHGRLGDSVSVWALTVHDGRLYASTLGGDERGHVFTYDGTDWHDLGPVGEANTVMTMASFRGQLYAGTTRYRSGGSGLGASQNDNPGGTIHRYDPDQGWVDVGRIDGIDSLSGFAVHRGELFASALYQRGVFRSADGQRWRSCGDPGRRLLALGLYDGHVFGAGNDHLDVDEAIRRTGLGEMVDAESLESGGGVFQLTAPDRWTNWGMLPDTTQLYSLAVSHDTLIASTWPNGLVYRREQDGSWTLTGRLGDETEVMGLITYNGVLYGGTLPHAQLYRFVRDGAWDHVGTLDSTPDVLYRRAASLAVYDGALFAGTLPSGRVHSMRTGNVTTHDSALEPGWHHVVATRRPGEVALYLDGTCVSRSQASDEPAGILPDRPLTIGNGTRARFDGLLRDVRLHSVSATPDQVSALHRAGDPRTPGPRSTDVEGERHDG